MLKAPKGRSSARPEQRIPNPYAAGSNPAAPATPSRPARLRRPSGRSPAAGPRLHAVRQLPAEPLYALLEGRHGEVPRPAVHRRPAVPIAGVQHEPGGKAELVCCLERAPQLLARTLPRALEVDPPPPSSANSSLNSASTWTVATPNAPWTEVDPPALVSPVMPLVTPVMRRSGYREPVTSRAGRWRSRSRAGTTTTAPRSRRSWHGSGSPGRGGDGPRTRPDRVVTDKNDALEGAQQRTINDALDGAQQRTILDHLIPSPVHRPAPEPDRGPTRPWSARTI